MAKDNEKISVNKFESSLPSDNIISETLSGTDDITIQIKKNLPLQEMLSFVQEVVEACVDVENGDYVPEAYDFAVRVGVLTHYANFAMPSNMEKQYWLVNVSPAFQQVLDKIDPVQFHEIIRTIDRKIKFMLDIITSSAVSKINEMINKFNDIADVSAEALTKMKPSEVMQLMKAVPSLGNVDQEKIANVILEMQKKSENSSEDGKS